MNTRGVYSLYIRHNADLWNFHGTFDKGKDLAKKLFKLRPSPGDYRIEFGSRYSYDYCFEDGSIILDAAWCYHRMTFTDDELRDDLRCPKCGCDNYKEGGS